MKDNFNTSPNDDSTNEWLTPPYIIKALGHFDLDPCAPRKESRPWNTADKHFTGARTLFDRPEDIERQDGLHALWEGRVWLNPPYGDETFEWLAKLKQHRSGVALIFARTETQGFHEQIFRKAHSLFFFKGRIGFYRVDGSLGTRGNAPSCLVSYCHADTVAISNSDLPGKLIIMGNL